MNNYKILTTLLNACLVLGIFAFPVMDCFAGRTDRDPSEPLAKANIPKQFVRSKAAVLNYLIYFPESYTTTDEAFPLLLFLHGGHEGGSDIELVKKHGPPKMIEEGRQFPMVVVSPQNPDVKGFWDEDLLVDLLNHIESTCRIDPDRIYLTGLSRGGYGAWRLAMENPTRFAAFVPISGAVAAPYAGWLGDLPIWVFHGALDNVIPVSESIEIVEAIRRNGGNVKFTQYPDAAHDAWTATYNNQEMWDWMLEQDRSKTISGNPANH